MERQKAGMGKVNQLLHMQWSERTSLVQSTLDELIRN